MKNSIAAFLSQWVAFEAHSIEAVLKIAKVTFSSLTWSAGPRVAVTDGRNGGNTTSTLPCKPGHIGLTGGASAVHLVAQEWVTFVSIYATRTSG